MKGLGTNGLYEFLGCGLALRAGLMRNKSGGQVG